MALRSLRLPLLVLTLSLLAASPARAGDAPSPCPWPEARQFDFWIGDWNATILGQPYGSLEGFGEIGSLTVQVFPLLDGCAIVEHTRRTGGDGDPYGFSLRFFDRREGIWKALLSWPDAEEPKPYVMTGSVERGRAEFHAVRQTPAGDDLLVRFTFSDVAEDRLRWDLAVANDGWGPVDLAARKAQVWFTQVIFAMERRGAMEPPLMNAPWVASRDPALCAGEVFRQLDHTLGTWSGTAELRPAAGEQAAGTARSRVTPILGGCALLEELEATVDGTTWKRVALRSYVPERQAWVEHGLGTLDLHLLGTFELFDGTGRASGTGMTFDGPSDEATGSGLRSTLERLPDGKLRRRLLRTTDGASWEEIAVFELRSDLE